MVPPEYQNRVPCTVQRPKKAMSTILSRDYILVLFIFLGRAFSGSSYAVLLGDGSDRFVAVRTRHLPHYCSSSSFFPWPVLQWSPVFGRIFPSDALKASVEHRTSENAEGGEKARPSGRRYLFVAPAVLQPQPSTDVPSHLQ